MPEQQGGASLAGNYGGIASRSTRGLRTSATTAGPADRDVQSIIELEKRLTLAEQELIDTKIEVQKLREIVETIQGKGA